MSSHPPPSSIVTEEQHPSAVSTSTTPMTVTSIYTKIANAILVVMVLVLVGYLGYWVYQWVYVTPHETISLPSSVAPPSATDAMVTPPPPALPSYPTSYVSQNVTIPRVTPPPAPSSLPKENIRLQIQPIEQQLPEGSSINAVQRSLEEILSKIKK